MLGHFTSLLCSRKFNLQTQISIDFYNIVLSEKRLFYCCTSLDETPLKSYIAYFGQAFMGPRRSPGKTGKWFSCQMLFLKSRLQAVILS